MLIVALAPMALLFVRRPDVLILHIGPNLRWDVGMQIATLPGIAAFAFLAPLAGYRRRLAILMTFPVVNAYYAWVVGARVATATR